MCTHKLSKMPFKANGEMENNDIVNILGFTFRDVLFERGKLCAKSFETHF
jgi:hypothetical protein